MNKRAKIQKLQQSKSPKTQDKHVGIEIEFFTSTPRNVILEELAKKDLQDYCDLGSDRSIEPDDDNYDDYHLDNCASKKTSTGCQYCPNECYCNSYCDCDGYDKQEGYELRILVKEKEVTKVMRKVNSVLRKIDAQTNYSCGLHVHLDIRNRIPEQTYRNLYHAQDVLWELVDSSRKDSEWCNPQDTEDFVNASSDKYHSINIEPVDDIETIEVRMHEGTTHYSTIVNWIKLLIRVADARRVIQIPYKDSQELIKTLKLPKTIRNYVEKKAA